MAAAASDSICAGSIRRSTSRISTEREHVELGDGRFDFAIRMAEAPVGPAEWHRLAPVGLVPVAAPDCRLSLPEALRRLPAIHVTGRWWRIGQRGRRCAACRRPIRRVGSASTRCSLR